MNRPKNSDHSFRTNIRNWFAIYAIWFLWESAVRILLGHGEWGIIQSMHYVGINVLYGSVWSLILGTVHSLLLRISSARRFLTPQAGVCLAALVTVPIMFSYRNYLSHTQSAQLFRWVSALLLLAVLYTVCLIVARRLTPLVVRTSVWAHRIFAFLVLVPLLTVAASFSFLDRGISEVPQGPIRYVVLISIDTLRYDYVSSYGFSQAQTPVMDQVASEGVRFENAIAPVPMTGPSHVSMFTGQSPLVHGVFYNGQPLQSKATTVTNRLRNAGFRTGGFISGYPLKTINCGLNRGFQVYDEKLSWIDFFNETFYGRIVGMLPFVSLGILRQAKEVTDPALRWLEENSDRPFFLFVHYYDPHYPYGRKSSFRHLQSSLRVIARPEDVNHQKRLYAEEVESVDAQIGRIIDLLKRHRIYDQTLLMITADHGESLGEHGYYYGHGFFVYEQLIHIPMILRCPVLIKSGVVVQQQVALMDIHKTILDAVGLKPSALGSRFDLIQVAQEPGIAADRTILSHAFPYDVHGLRTKDWKLIKNARKNQYELYDLKTDPGETNNLYATNTITSARLKRSLEELMISLADDREKWSPKDLSAEQIEQLKSLGYLN